MANVVINGGQLSTNIRNVVLTITSLTRQFIYVSETEMPNNVTDIGSNWIDTQSVDPFTINFVVSPAILGYSPSRHKIVYVQFADDAAGLNYNPGVGSGETVASSIDLYQNIRLPVITYPQNGAEVTNRSIIVQGTAEAGATVTVRVEALN